MIRINLLAADGAARSKKKTAAVLGTTGQRLTVGCTLILILSALFVGWRYWTVTRESSDLDREISAAQQETTRLQSVIQQVQQFEQRKAQLQQRCAATDAVAHGIEAGRSRRADRRESDDADRRVGFRRESRSHGLFQAIDRNREHDERGDAAAAR